MKFFKRKDDSYVLSLNSPIMTYVKVAKFIVKFRELKLATHSSEKRGLRPTFLSSEMLQNLLYL